MEELGPATIGVMKAVKDALDPQYLSIPDYRSRSQMLIPYLAVGS